MSADIRVLYRIGLSEADAEHALYDVAQPDVLVREVAGRVISRFFAGRTLDSVLDQRREKMAEDLQSALSGALDRPHSGLEVVSVTVEAVHPPAGAAAAYHAVQAAEIIANTSIASETGRARSTASMARSQSWDLLDRSRAAAAETIAAADADSRRFLGDRTAKDAGGQAFLIERYFQTVSAAMARAPLTIVDQRVAPGMAPVIDLRPFAAAARTIDDGD
jgi:regulator of protease activity HflC (stomatin/prohibitin superfamily)